MRRLARVAACGAALFAGSAAGIACSAWDCPAAEAFPVASYFVSEADGLEQFSGATVDAAAVLTVAFEDEAGNRWQATYQIAHDD